jgi:lipopolysaccharide transport system permease protein
VTLGAALFHTATSLGVWLLAYLLFLGPPHPTALEIPLVLLPLSWLILGVCWILASLGVYFRDLVHLVSFFLSVLLFMSPIFYPLTALPERFQTLLLLNPLAPAIEQMRNLLFWGKGLAPESLAGYYLFTGLFAWLGFACFQRTRKGFADVL